MMSMLTAAKQQRKKNGDVAHHLVAWYIKWIKESSRYLIILKNNGQIFSKLILINEANGSQPGCPKKF